MTIKPGNPRSLRSSCKGLLQSRASIVCRYGCIFGKLDSKAGSCREKTASVSSSLLLEADPTGCRLYSKTYIRFLQTPKALG